MKTLSFGLLILFMVKCSYCGKDFLSLGRYTWCCKSKNHQESQGFHRNSENINKSFTREVPAEQLNVVNTGVIKCICGKKCKGFRRLKMHHRSCQTIKTIFACPEQNRLATK